MITIKLHDEFETKVNYDHHTSKLIALDGTPAFDFSDHPLRTIDSWHDAKPAIAISPDSPGKKVKKVKRLKIQLGLGCNYKCSYCLQSAEIHKATASNLTDTKAFLETLDTWLDGENLEKIEFWGGEPLLYWPKIEFLIPKLKSRFPKARMSMITNGTLLTKDIINHLYYTGFGIAISHDGPAQWVRGPDPLQDPAIKEIWTHAMYALSAENRITFNAVLTPASHDVAAIIDWFQEALPGSKVLLEGVVHDYSGDKAAIFEDEALIKFSNQLTEQILEGTALRSPTVYQKMFETLSSIVNEKPSFVLGQKCGMDQEDQIAVDLKGNVVTCQNVGASGIHKIGHVSDFDNIKLASSWHWSKRVECSSCPVLQMCKGGCMYQEGDQFTNSCNAEFAYNFAFFSAAITLLTGRRVLGIAGDFVRPKLKKDCIPN